VLGIFLGTGLGGALIIDGRPFLGAKGHAGNIGHYLLEALGPLAGSTRHGVLDDMVGRTAIAGAAASLAAKHLAPHLLESVGTEVSKIRSGELAEAIEKGDESIEELIRSRMRLLGIALSNMVDFLTPEMIVLGGGMTEAMPELVRQEVQMGIADHATARARDELRVVVAKLGSHAVTTGAAKWAMDQQLSTDPITSIRPAPRASKRPPGTPKSRSA
jgi:glucokinase